MDYYAALTSLLQTIEQIPQPVQEIICLQEKVSRLLVILEDSSQKSRFTIISYLEGQIRDASYEARDIIERSVEFQGLEEIIDEFDSILKAMSKIEDGKVEDPRHRNSLTAGSSRSVATNKSASLVGLDEDLMQIKGQLTGSPSKLDIISNVGMGGIGKTTLARNLYNDPLIEYHFDCRAWIVVSQAYNLIEMLTSLVASTRQGCDELCQKSIEELSELLYKSLKGRRYLIVMDDVWDTKAWDDVKRFFPDDNNGSRIILTTRTSEVAMYPNSYSPIHNMSFLSEEASWILLREKILGEEYCPSALENIGKKIAQDCKGLPLAIVVIGGLLSKGSKTRDYWEYVAENVKSAITGTDDQFVGILSLSYNSLPHHLKPCFLYMGVFPEDYVIFVSQLIKLWIAEGFVKPLGHKSFEEVAEDYLKDLIDRSLILVDKRNHNGGIKTCTIHDLLRELCLKKAQNEKFLRIMNSDVCGFPQERNNQCRVSIHSDILNHLKDARDASVRTLLYFCKCRSNSQLLSFTMSSKLLRILDALTVIFHEFPIEIMELVHLRYLAFIYRGSSKLPASISKLQNLQTLIVFRGWFYISTADDTLYLPATIWEMPQLRHLLFERSFLPAQTMGKDYVALENLQTLSGLINFICARKVLEIVPNLKKLEISYVYDVDTEWSSYEFNNFVYLHHLETLKCLFVTENFQAWRPLPVHFALPTNLKKLTLSGCRICWTKMTIIGSLPNLEVLKLKDNAFEGSVWEPNEGEFSKLKFLLIDMSVLEHWRATDAHFPHLEHLSLIYCPVLVEIPSEIGEIPTLEMLELCGCSPSAEASAKLIQEEQQSLENNTLRVHISSEQDLFKSQQNTSLRKVHMASPDWF